MASGSRLQNQTRIALVVCALLWTGWVSYGQLQKRSAAALATEGNALLKEHRYEAAVENFDQALEKYPELPSIRVNRGIALQLLGRTEEALESFRQEEIRTGSPRATVGIARLLRELDNVDAAMRALDRIEGRLPGPSYSRERGLCLLALGQAEAARPYLEEAQRAGVSDAELTGALEEVLSPDQGPEQEGGD